MLLGGVPGVAPGKVVIVGGGVVGTHAAKMAVGLGAEVTILDRSLPRLRELDDLFGGRVQLLYASMDEVEQAALAADLVVGAVLVPGAAAPKLLTRAQLARMQPGAVIVDVAIDQGGCFETSRATTHAEPTYVVDGVVHYCVANMPGARAAHVHLRAEQRHAAVHAGAGRQGLAPRLPRRSAPARGPERARRPDHLRGGGAGPGQLPQALSARQALLGPRLSGQRLLHRLRRRHAQGKPAPGGRAAA